MHTTNQNQSCYDQGYNKEGTLIDRIMLVTQAVNALGYFIIAPIYYIGRIFVLTAHRKEAGRF